MPGADDPVVLHFTAADADRGGILSVVRGLAGAGEFACVLGVNPGFVQERAPRLQLAEFPRLAGETIDLHNFWRARAAARAVRGWLRDDGRRVYHGHSRAGLLVALWLVWMGESRVVVSVHCYGRHRWFYRWAARRLGGRLYWLSPAMKRHYGVGDGSWTQCIPGCVGVAAAAGPRRPWRGDGILRLGGVGTLVRWKRWDLVLAALRGLDPAERAVVEFRHLGGADDSPGSRSYAEALREQAAGLPVTWGGWRAEPASFYGEIDALVVASDGEPFSAAMLEALMAGVPVVAVDLGGAVDVIEPPRNGWLFRSGDAADLARAIRRLLAPDSAGPAAIDPEGLRRFEPTVVAAQWRRVYAKLGSGDRR